jgi:hypothetical protein
MVRIPSHSAPPSKMGSRRPSDNSANKDIAGENGKVNADDLFENEEDREARTQMDDFYKEFCKSRALVLAASLLLKPITSTS